MGECCNNKEDISLSCHCGANDSFKNSSFQPKCQNCSVKKKVRSEKEFKALLNRLSRIEGQVRGVRSMLENDAYCIDILTQVSAINAALNSFNKVLIANHIRTCVKKVSFFRYIGCEMIPTSHDAHLAARIPGHS